ncbi:hypothetical protein BG011_010274, partial [Mortierella polycephala]
MDKDIFLDQEPGPGPALNPALALMQQHQERSIHTHLKSLASIMDSILALHPWPIDLDHMLATKLKTQGIIHCQTALFPHEGTYPQSMDGMRPQDRQDHYLDYPSQFFVS